MLLQLQAALLCFEQLGLLRSTDTKKEHKVYKIDSKHRSCTLYFTEQ